MEKLSLNDLMVSFDKDNNKIVIYRLIFKNSEIVGKSLLTEYSVEQMKKYPISEIEQKLGESILLFMKGTRRALKDREINK